MKLGFYFNDQGFQKIDLRYPNEGNNGIGGTEFCYVMVASAILEHSTNHIITFYHYNNDNMLPRGVRSVIIGDSDEMLEKASGDEIDILVFTAADIKKLKRLEETNIKCIAWAHNFLLSDALDKLVRSTAVSRVLFVGKEQYDRYIDHGIIKKSVFIFNMFDSSRFPERPWPDAPAVTYTGALVQTKGFHILASVWKDITKEVPNAHLYVIGSGKLYSRDAELGAFGVAERGYEDVFIPSLTENGELMPSVNFLSKNGVITAKEKVEVYDKTTVGVVNPSGRSEIFSSSVVEMNAFGIPVVTAAKNGLFDSVSNGKTGFLIKNTHALRKHIVELLKDKAKNQAMGRKAKMFVESSLAPELMVKQWLSLLEDVAEDKPCAYQKPTAHYTNNHKWIRMVIRFFREHGIPLKPFVDFESSVWHFLNRIKQ